MAYLPDTYSPTDGSIRISDCTPSRAECGLPERGFVFCAFCLDHKINPLMFDIWMRLLDHVPDSLLWLVSRNEISNHNLYKEAELRDVSGGRLVFAERVPMVEDHLARYRQADLFLDTRPYNGHTTTADAPLAGLPVLTYMDEPFPSRAAGSLLHATGLPEVITRSRAEYEERAMQLAGADTHPLRCFLCADLVFFQHVQYLCPFHFFLTHEVVHSKIPTVVLNRAELNHKADISIWEKADITTCG